MQGDGNISGAELVYKNRKPMCENNFSVVIKLLVLSDLSDIWTFGPILKALGMQHKVPGNPLSLVR